MASYWALAVVFAAVYFGALFSPALLDDADSTHAEAAREMFVSGDYVTLHVNGVRYLEKAPLLYWLVAICYHIFGVNEFASRLPMAVSVLLLGVLAVVWVRRAFGERAGIYAGVFVYTAAGVFLFTRILIPDVLLSLLIAAFSPCSKSTKVSAGQIFCLISSRVTTAPARLSSSSRMAKGWPRSLTGVPFLDNSWAQVRASNGPKRKINEGVSMPDPARGGA